MAANTGHTTYTVHIDRQALREDDKLIMVQFPAMRSQFDRHADSVQLSIKQKTLRMRLQIEDGNTYASTKNNIDDSQLFICKKVNDKLICLPLSQVCTMRSDFSHLNPKEEVDPREEVRPVSVKFSASDRHQTPSRFLNKEPEIDDSNEDFRRLSFKSLDSKYASNQREMLFGKSVKIKADPDAAVPMDTKLDVKPSDLPDIKPKLEKLDSDERRAFEDIYSPNYQAHLAQGGRRSDLTRKRVKECLTKAKIVSFQELHQFIVNYPRLPASVDDTVEEPIAPNPRDMLEALNEFAILVQGNWAIKSEVLYGDSGVRDFTDVTDIPINLFTTARDFLLWLFNQNRIVSRTQYSKRVKIPDHDILELFNQLATYRTDLKKWELKLPTDERFLANFPEVVQRQTTFWKVRKANKLSIFNK